MNHRSTMRVLGRHGAIATGLAVGVVLLSGCASNSQLPTASLEAARESIASAERAGSRRHAGAELDEAKQRLQMAERAVTEEQMIRAKRLADESRVVAELASARTELAKAAEINREMGRGAEALSEEMKRMGDQQR